MDCLDDALALSDLGISVIPIKATPGKTPALRKWTPYQSERADSPTIHDWFDGRDDLNVGVVCGTVSDRLVVRDFDDNLAYKTWAASHGSLAKSLPQVRTSRGIHVYCRLPDGESLETFAFPDGELRGEKHYVVAPPSLHSSGSHYRWVRKRPTSIPVVSMDDLGFLPSVSTDEPLRRESGGGCFPSLPPSEAWSGFKVIRYMPTKTGERHRKLFDLMLAMRRLCPSGTIDEAMPTIRRWWKSALPHIKTKDWFTTMADAMDGWGRIRHLATEDVPGEAFQLALTRTPPECATNLGDGPVQLLVAWCAELSRLNSGGVFFLACRTVEQFMPEISNRTAALWLRQLCRLGILELVARGNKTKAARYRYLGGRPQ
jgi:hypothetical protein